MRNKKVIFFGVAFFIILLIVAVLSSDRVEEDGDLVPIPPYVVKESKPDEPSPDYIVPGTSTFQEVATQLQAEVLTQQSVGQGKVVAKVSWPSKYVPSEIGYDKENVVVYYKIPAFTISLESFSEEVSRNQLGTPDFTMYVKNDDKVKASVFLSKGMFYEYNEFTEEILAIAYFTPVSKEEFLITWGKNLTPTFIQYGH